MAETIVLDPSEVATARSQLDISPYVKAEGVDWGQGEIEAFMSDRERGSSAVDYRIPNRQIVLPMNIKQVGTTTFAQARRNLQAKVARIQAEGGWLKRTTQSGATVFADIVNATLRLGGDWMQARQFAPVDVNAELRLEAIPDWYGAEITLPDHVETTQGELIWTETNVLGDYPGRVRIVVDEDQNASQMGLLWGVRCRHYSNSTTAALRYTASTCTPLDASAVAGSSIQHLALSTNWTPVMSTNQTGGVALTHTGTYRVWVKCGGGIIDSSGGNHRLVDVRLIWDVGDFAFPTENEPKTILTASSSYVLDLGEVRLDRVPSGTHRWQGIIQARGDQGSEGISIDKIWLQPVDEGCGVLRAPFTMEPGLTGFSARDEFNQTGGVLTGKAAPAGGAWQGIGDTDDFVVDANVHTARRTALGDTGAGPWVGRFATLPVSLSTVAAQVAIHSTSISTQFQQGVTVRYSNSSQNLMMQVRLGIASVIATISGTPNTLWSGTIPRNPNQWIVLRLAADAAGRWWAWSGPAGGQLTLRGSGQLSNLATGGNLASGAVGFYDAATSSVEAATRNYDGFAAWVPQLDAVLHPTQSAELRTEGMFREESTGTAFGPVTYVVGDLPRIPPSGNEGRTVQFFLKGSRGDFETLPDTAAADDISARLTYRPSYLTVS